MRTVRQREDDEVYWTDERRHRHNVRYTGIDSKAGKQLFWQEKEQGGEDRHTAFRKRKSGARGHKARQHSDRQQEAYIAGILTE